MSIYPLLMDHHTKEKLFQSLKEYLDYKQTLTLEDSWTQETKVLRDIFWAMTEHIFSGYDSNVIAPSLLQNEVLDLSDEQESEEMIKKLGTTLRCDLGDKIFEKAYKLTREIQVDAINYTVQSFSNNQVHFLPYIGIQNSYVPWRAVACIAIMIVCLTLEEINYIMKNMLGTSLSMEKIDFDFLFEVFLNDSKNRLRDLLLLEQYIHKFVGYRSPKGQVRNDPLKVQTFILLAEHDYNNYSFIKKREMLRNHGILPKSHAMLPSH